MKPAPLSVQQIRASLTTQRVGQQLHYFASLGSTNDEAKRLAEAGVPAGTVVIADEQTAGRGRMGRRWVAPPNTCLLMSLIFRPGLAPPQASRLTMLCSLAAADAIEEVTGLAVSIKWPNDLVVPGSPIPDSSSVGEPYRKLAGLLTETTLSDDRLLFAVVGMGINVNVDPTVLGSVITPATSLLAELGRPVDRVPLAVAILHRIEALSSQLAGLQLHVDWAQRLVTLGQRVAVTIGAQQLRGVAEGVDPDGALLVRDLAGNLHLVAAGDVNSWFPTPDSQPRT